jgi:uncharacterized protein
VNPRHVAKIAGELGLHEKQVRTAAVLLQDGNTVPFLARYRKEATGGLDEVHIIVIRDRLEKMQELEKRRESILGSLTDRGKLTDELREQLENVETLAQLEDIYLPFRPKRRTRGLMAREKGLEPLAKQIFQQDEMNPKTEAAAFVDPERGVESTDQALGGARDIIAEWINEDPEARADLRELFFTKAAIQSRVVKDREDGGQKYKDYFAWQEPLRTAPSHRILAIRRGAAEGFLTLRILPYEEEAIASLEKRFLKGEGPGSEQVRLAIKDCYKRLLSPSMETETRLDSKKRADETAIRVFAANLRELLLAAPLGQKAVLAIDPGYRTGCKVVCLDRQGKFLHHETIFPLEPHNNTQKSAEILKTLVQRFHAEAIAVGNGTGGREAHAFCKSIDFHRTVPVVMVNESGASVYSVSETAREEFPSHDVTVRGAVSIGRRLQDPLAELVKIDPKSIGVGQYQHDVDQKALKRALEDVVISCVNTVGVEVNTSSRMLLNYVSGLSWRLAGNLVAFRDEKGAVRSRAELMEVPGMGAKAFEQAAGFLRIRGAEHPLDASAVHPERYPVVENMAKDLGCSVADLMRDPELRGRIKLERYTTVQFGLPTLLDIMDELAKPGRDPREPFELFSFTEGIDEISDVEVGRKLPGVVTNVTAFGAFVDIGVHQDGLVHISELADRFIRDPNEVVKVHQKVMVTVMAVDLERNRISLSMRKDPFKPRRRADGQPKTKEKS